MQASFIGTQVRPFAIRTFSWTVLSKFTSTAILVFRNSIALQILVTSPVCLWPVEHRSHNKILPFLKLYIEASGLPWQQGWWLWFSCKVHYVLCTSKSFRVKKPICSFHWHSFIIYVATSTFFVSSSLLLLDFFLHYASCISFSQLYLLQVLVHHAIMEKYLSLCPK